MPSVDSASFMGIVDRCPLSAWRPPLVGFARLRRWGFTWCLLHSSSAPADHNILAAFGVFVVGLLRVRIEIIMAHLNHTCGPWIEDSDGTLRCSRAITRCQGDRPDDSLKPPVPVRCANIFRYEAKVSLFIVSQPSSGWFWHHPMYRCRRWCSFVPLGRHGVVLRGDAHSTSSTAHRSTDARPGGGLSLRDLRTIHRLFFAGCLCLAR